MKGRPRKGLYSDEEYERRSVAVKAKKYPCHTWEEARVRPGTRFGAYRRQAESRGISFELTLEQFKVLFFQPCTFCGEEPSYGVDRVDNSKAYTVDNSAPCCKHCNSMKSDFDYEFFLSHVRRIVAFREG